MALQVEQRGPLGSLGGEERALESSRVGDPIAMEDDRRRAGGKGREGEQKEEGPGKEDFSFSWPYYSPVRLRCKRRPDMKKLCIMLETLKQGPR